MIQWLPEQQINQLNVSANLRFWLCEPDCLTAELRKHYADVHIVLVSMDFGPIYIDEANYLAPHHSSKNFLVRQTHLACQNGLLTFARVIIPEQTYTASQQAFDTLGTQPIGENMLYGQHHIKRSGFECALITPDQWASIPALSAAMPQDNRPSSLGARRSIFFIDSNPLLISEYYLPMVAQLKRPDAG